MTTDVPLPGLDEQLLDRWAGAWDDTGLWNDIATLSAHFWSAAGDENAAGLAWHHLVLAVGNFKRQAGRIRLRLAGETSAGTPIRAERFDVPGTHPPLPLSRDDRDSWNALADEVTGFGVPTTTTLLAALWPDTHFVVDWRVRAAANGLRIHANLPPTNNIHPDHSGSGPITFDDYATIRAWVLNTGARTQRPVVVVERALYELSRAVKSKAGRSWSGYAAALAETLHA